ncbi:MAG: hypothetical protein H7833_04440 [Magnetococcus sp. DMHC-1]
MSQILSRLSESGFNVSLVGGGLHIHPTPGPALLAMVRQHKPELVALLRQGVANDPGPPDTTTRAANDEQGGSVANDPELPGCLSPGGPDLPDTVTSNDTRESIQGKMISSWMEPDVDRPTFNPETFDPDAFEERSAIVEHDGGIPKEWAEGLARLCVMPRPADIPAKQWQAIILAAGIFSDRWAKQAAALGWTTEEVFGCSAKVPALGYGSRGLVFSMGDPGSTLVAMDKDKATFRTKGGARQVFIRDYFNMDRTKLRMVWNQTSGEEIRI